jgi:hypothetical protein
MRNRLFCLLLGSTLVFLSAVPAAAEDGNDGPEKLSIQWEEGRGDTDWWGITADSMICLGYFHGFRMTEEKTRKLFGGPFFKDWGDSIKALEWKWDDGGKFFTNYVAHPWQGSTYAFIFADNHKRSNEYLLGWNKEYWNAKHKQFLFSLASTIQFEIGPISEASLGNVGINRPGAMTIIDFIVTPVVGTYGWSVLEDGIDRIAYSIEDEHKYWGRIIRSLCLTRSFVNLFIGFRLPWYRHRDKAVDRMRTRAEMESIKEAHPERPFKQ